MIKVSGKDYTAEYIQRAVTALEAAGVKDDGKDSEDVYLSAMTEKGEIRVSIATNEYHSVFVDLMANFEQCCALNLTENLPKGNDTISLPLATIEVADASTDGEKSYAVEEGKSSGCPRIFLYDKLDDECSHIVLIDGKGMTMVRN